MTTAAACAVSLWLTRSLPAGDSLALVGGLAGGGFFIDVDHAIDYVLVDRQRDLRPASFLRYFLDGRVKRAVLVLHSYELFAGLSLLALWLDTLSLWGYLAGGLMHLALDIVVNGQCAPRRIAAFYSFGYRLAHRFDAQRLLGLAGRVAAPAHFWGAFFAGASIVRVADRSEG